MSIRMRSHLTSACQLLSLLATFAVDDSVEAGNFVCNDPTLQQVAERARESSARFWTGKPLPGEWHRSCPIEVQPAAHAGGGITRFQFAGGEVFGWDMQVTGSRDALIYDVIPHEVDHMVRATLVRHPIERWLDEGCASLFESPASHQRLRQLAARLTPDCVTPELLNGQDYPADSATRQQLYAIGFALVETLLSEQGPRQLLELQRRTDSMESRLQDIYTLTVTELTNRTWRRMKQPADGQHRCQNNCLLHQQASRFPDCRCEHDPAEILTIWTATWCGPCHHFWNDWHADQQFQNQITARFQIHVRDFDLHREEAERQGIHDVPTFQTAAGRVSGYRSKESLLHELGVRYESEPSPPNMIDVEEPTPILNLQEEAPSGDDAATDSSNVSSPASTESLSEGPERGGRSALAWLPVTWTALQWAGVVGGSTATGGLAGVALSSLFWSLRRRRRRQQDRIAQAAWREDPTRAPFPRQLDEARELLRLRESEGRVAVLDTLRGMFLDDELDKLTATSDKQTQTAMKKLKTAIDTRIDEVAPLST